MPRTLSLIRFRQSRNIRSHFAIFVPSSFAPDNGTLIHVVGAPMAGFALEFQRNMDPGQSRTFLDATPLGQVHDSLVVDPPSAGARSSDNTPRDALERIASQVDPPRISQNFLAPVNDTTNRRCQEWTMDYIRRLVEQSVLDSSAIDTAQSLRDAPSHGVGLQPVRRDEPAVQAQQQVAATTANATGPATVASAATAYTQSASGQGQNGGDAGQQWHAELQRWITWSPTYQRWMYYDDEQRQWVYM